MLVLISPAKNLNANCDNSVISSFTTPLFLENSKKIVYTLRKYSSESLSKLMNVSNKISILNYERFIKWTMPFNINNSYLAVLLFQGDVYKGLSVKDFNKEDFAFAQKTIRILSGLYGILKPLDLIQPYRLEMATPLKIGKYINLYDFWGNKITDAINQEKNNNYLINLASVEYFKSINKKYLKLKLINIFFKEKKNGNYSVIGIHAKKARGVMARYIIKNKINDPKDLKNFNMNSYRYNEDLSEDSDWVFTR